MEIMTSLKLTINFKKIAVLALSIGSLTGCYSFTQQPAPVVEGFFDKSYRPERVVEIEKHHYVNRGDDLASVASKYNISTESLRIKNRLNEGSSLRQGQMLKIPTQSENKKINSLASNLTSDSYTYSLTRKFEPAAGNSNNDNNSYLSSQQVASLGVKPSPRYSLSRKKMLNTNTDTNPVMEKVSIKEGTINPTAKKKISTNLTHKIAKGDNIYRVGLKYGVSQAKIMKLNGIADPSNLSIGQVIKIPGKFVTSYENKQDKVASRKSSITKSVVSRKAKINKTQKIARNSKSKREFIDLKASRRGFVWPADGNITQKFGKGGEGVNHTGIKISLPKNAPIVAASNGKVIYSGNGLENFGNLILIKHKNGYVTAYAHNDKNLVAKDEAVKRGEVIAFAGHTGDVDNTQLHFEVRRNSKAIDPLRVLPK